MVSLIENDPICFGVLAPTDTQTTDRHTHTHTHTYTHTHTHILLPGILLGLKTFTPFIGTMGRKGFFKENIL